MQRIPINYHLVEKGKETNQNKLDETILEKYKKYKQEYDQNGYTDKATVLLSELLDELNKMEKLLIL